MDVQQDQGQVAEAPQLKKTSEELLIIFYKNPVKGKVKTRIAKTLGADKALEIYKNLADHNVNITSGLVNCDKVVFYSDSIENKDVWSEKKFIKQEQKGHDLGERLINAFKKAFTSGYKKVVVIGTDCDRINQEHIEIAFEKLNDSSAVIGPAIDGGYYLLGMRKLIPDLFINKSWSTSNVFSETLLTLKKKRINFSTLDILSDVDEEKDLKTYAPLKNTISIIIPTYNEADNIGNLIDYLKNSQKQYLLEILVVDGGSKDDTVKIAKSRGATVIISPKKGRAVQMNAGAEIANGEILYFLHADTLPPNNYDETIVETLINNNHWGSFKIKFDHNHWLLIFIAWFTKLNFIFFRFGDQSLFLKKELFTAIGKFNPAQIVFEDTEIARRLKLFSKGKIIHDPVITSARKFKDNGVYKMSLIFFYVWILYLLGASQDKILYHYKKLIIQDKI